MGLEKADVSGLSVEVALKAIDEGTGSQFDPQLAPRFIAMMRARFEERKAA